MLIKWGSALIVCFCMLSSAMAQSVDPAARAGRTIPSGRSQPSSSEAGGKAGSDVRTSAAATERIETEANLGVRLFFNGRCDDAVKHLTSALRLDPYLGKIRALLGVCDYRLGRRREALENLSQALADTHEFKIRLYIKKNLLAIDYQEGHLDKAAKVARSLLALEPNNVDVIYMIYRIHRDIANRARNYLAVHAPNSAQMHQIMAEELISEGDTADAITQFERAIAKSPNLPGLYYELAEARMEDSVNSGSLEKASALLRKALSLNPSNAGAIAKLGEIALIRDDDQSAQSKFLKALTINPNTEDALNGMATIAQRKGDYEKAIGYLSRAAQVDPLNPEICYRLSGLYRRLHQEAAAKKEMKRFLSLRSLLDKTQLSQIARSPQ